MFFRTFHKSVLDFRYMNHAILAATQIHDRAKLKHFYNRSGYYLAYLVFFGQNLDEFHRFVHFRRVGAGNEHTAVVVDIDRLKSVLLYDAINHLAALSDDHTDLVRLNL